MRESDIGNYTCSLPGDLATLASATVRLHIVSELQEPVINRAGGGRRGHCVAILYSREWTVCTVSLCSLSLVVLNLLDSSRWAFSKGTVVESMIYRYHIKVVGCLKWQCWSCDNQHSAGMHRNCLKTGTWGFKRIFHTTTRLDGPIFSSTMCCEIAAGISSQKDLPTKNWSY